MANKPVKYPLNLVMPEAMAVHQEGSHATYVPKLSLRYYTPNFLGIWAVN
jgi:hypothetical protein